eukprot:CAMPEP_0114561738 /NCGR_PEP_ID=MMETSP0114-20121206/12160_1 /TAXON_ID=31324 /ORGANISM="Goniomonas sp, Strain m" /LENGTH=54 /DNA_ID=CAMNT_0001747385 /DNA_START=42 /DNA_END=203 /DNA_ORIENTATION=-
MSEAQTCPSLMQPVHRTMIVPKRLSPPQGEMQESGSGQGNHNAPKQVDCPHLRN